MLNNPINAPKLQNDLKFDNVIIRKGKTND